MTRFYFLRHGITEINEQRRFNGGRVDSPLTPEGIEQTKKLRPFFANLRFDAIYVSPQFRAQTTLQLAVNPKSVFTNAINGTYELVDGYLNENLNRTFSLNPMEEAFVLNADLELKGIGEEVKSLDGYALDLALGVNYPAKTLNLDLDANYNEEAFINLFLSYLNGRAYLDSDDIYDRVLDLGEASIDGSIFTIQDYDADINYDDLHVILSEMKDIFINSLDEDKFRTDNEAITINDRNIDSKKITYVLDKSNLERTIEYVQREMANNNELLTALSNISGASTSDIQELLKEEIDLSEAPYMELNLYVNAGNHIIAGSLVVEKDSVMRFTYQSEVFNMIIGDEDTNFDIAYQDNTLTISYNEMDEEILNLTYTKEDDQSRVEVTTSSYGEDYTFILDISNIKESKNEMSFDIGMSYAVDSYGTENIIDLNGSIQMGKGSLNSLDVTNSVDVDTLTEEEQNVIMENVMSILERFGISEDVTLE